MANWYGTARTNYVRIKDEQALRQALEPWNIGLHKHPSYSEFIMLSGSGEDGDFPSGTIDDDGNDIEFSFEECVVPHLAEGQVLLVEVVGAEKLRYVTGHATAYAWDGRTVSLSLSSIHRMAAEAFGVDPSEIAHATYQDVPEALTRNEQDRPRG